VKRNGNRVRLFFVILLLTGLFIPAYPVFAKGTNHKQITQDLINLLKNNPEIRTMPEASIAEAKKINPDPKTNPVQNLSDYYDYIDSASELIPQNVLENPSNLIREQILQSICYFYFLIDQPLPELQDKDFFKNSGELAGRKLAW